MFGNPETTPGGNALKFYASVRLDIRRNDTLKDGDGRAATKWGEGRQEQGGAAVCEAEFDIIFGEASRGRGSVLDVALEHKSRCRSRGSYFSFGDERLGQGRTNVKAFLVEHADVTAGSCSMRSRRQLPDAVIPRRTPAPDGPVKMPVSDDSAPSDAAASANRRLALVRRVGAWWRRT